MRIRKLAIAALIAAVPTATAFAQGALDQSVPRVSPTTQPRVSPTTPSPTNPSRTGIRERETVTTPGEIPERRPVTAPSASDVVRDPRPMGEPPHTR